MTGTDRRIPYRIKSLPEDFRVDEVTDLRISRRGRFRIYRLTKTDWNTTDLIVRLSRDLRLPRDTFSFGGRKDRRAVTTQFVSIRDRADRSTAGPGYTLECVGSTDEPMTSQRIRANEFAIVIRGVNDADLPSIRANIEAVRASGLPNYFDDQRFGSLDPERGMLGEAILRGRWENALRIYLTLAPPDATDAAQAHGRQIASQWRNWKACLAESRTTTERRIFEALLVRGADFNSACRQIPSDAVSMALTAYQSHLWNRVACSVAANASDEAVEVPGLAGGYLFPLRWRPGAITGARRLSIPLPGPRMRWIHPELARAYTETLERAGLSEDSFVKIGLPTSGLRAVPRDFLMRPARLRMAHVEPDERTPGANRCTLSFSLPRGAYGTMLVRRLAIR
jgi:tRNA pseudouridine13 synthase